MVNENKGATDGSAMGKPILNREVPDCIWTVGGVKVKSRKETLSVPSLKQR